MENPTLPQQAVIDAAFEPPPSDLQPVATPTPIIVVDQSLSQMLADPTTTLESAPVPTPAPAAPAPAAGGRTRATTERPPLFSVDSELTKAVSEIRTTHGAGSIVTADKLPSFNQVPTGVFVLDYSLLGGVHVGLSSQFYGWENVGKTSMLLRLMKNLQVRYPDRAIIFAPLEGTFDPEHARIFGVDLSRVVIVKADSTETMIDTIIRLYHPLQTCAIFLDSIPAMVPKAVIEKSAEDKTMAEAARLATILFQKLNAALWVESKRDHLVSFFATNQWRLNPGKMFGDPRYLPGGNHQKFFFTNFIEIKSKEAKGDDQTGQQVLAQLDQAFHIDKAKVGACVLDGDFKTVISPSHPSGLAVGEIDDATVVAFIAKKHGVIGGGSGAWKVYAKSKTPIILKNIEMITAFFYSQPLEYIALKQRIIADLRKSRGRPPFPPDGYLLNYPKLFDDI